jgi:hypothetical protein
MKKEKNIDYYYNKLLQYRNEFNSRNSLKEITRNGKEVKTLLENIMDIHKDYLLTNGFLAFIVCRSLDGRNYPDNELFRERVKYYLNLVSTLDDDQLMVFLKRNYFYRTFSTPVSYYLTPNERLLVKIYRNAFKEIDKMKIPWGTNNYLVACEVLSSYGAIALYNQTFDKYEEVVANFLKNIDEFAVQLKLNGIAWESDRILHDTENEWYFDRQQLINYLNNRSEQKMLVL